VQYIPDVNINGQCTQNANHVYMFMDKWTVYAKNYCHVDVNVDGHVRVRAFLLVCVNVYHCLHFEVNTNSTQHNSPWPLAHWQLLLYMAGK